MATFSPSERRIAKALDRVPFVKKNLKRVYSFLNYIMYAVNRSRVNLRIGTLYRVNDLLYGEFQDWDTFFGYYDKYPMNNAGLILTNYAICSTKKKPSTNYAIHIALIDSSAQDKVLLDIETQAYNWQQGCRAHWLNNDLFILNDFDTLKKRYIARVFSVSSLKEVKRFDYPVQDSYQTDYFLSINYRRINKLRPDYGYRNLPEMTDLEVGNLDNDGIWKVDYTTENAQLLYSLEQIVFFKSEKVELNTFHKVNHLMINETGDKFIFIHRYLKDGIRFDRLILANLHGDLLKVLSDNGMVSHCCWINKNTVFAYLRGSDGLDAYYSIDIESGKMSLFENELFKKYGDGHPSSNGNFILTDSYPDKSRHQHLILYDINQQTAVELGSFFHGFSYDEETRCDLHPRLSPDAKRIFFDSVCSGKRQLYYIDLE